MQKSSKCCICGIENPENSHFWKSHHITEANYYLKYFPKTDKLTEEILLFKDRDSYLLTDFSNKNNKNKWFKLQNLETRRNYLKQLLINRKELKNWLWIPTQVELRSCPELVGVKTFNDNFKQGYYKLCEEIGYKGKDFININKDTILKKSRDIRGNPVLVDSREQQVLNWHNKEINITTLQYGDYCLKNDNYGLFFERKNLSDFVGSFSKGYDRLKNEIGRALINNDYIIMLVESSLTDSLSFEYQPQISRKIQATAPFIFHRVRSMIQEFCNFQILFCSGRTDMVNKMRFIMEYGKEARNIDWELASNLKLFNVGI